MKYLYKIFIGILIFQSVALGQKTQRDFDPQTIYLKGVELFNKEKYGSAQEQFVRLLDTESEISSVSKNQIIDAAYYSAVCAMQLYHADAEKKLVSFIKKYPDNPKVLQAKYQLANLYYRQNMFTEAAEWYDKIEAYNFTNVEAAELYFKMGYCYFRRNNYEKAQKAFYEIIEINNKYSAPANYYYGYIAYVNKNYPSALKSFLKLTDSEAYGKIMPSYIIQIYYMQGKYDQLIAYAEKLFDPELYKNSGKINVLVAQAYYSKKNYKKAAEYLEGFLKTSNIVTHELLYQYAFALYQSKQYEKAIEPFQRLSEEKDSLAQNALYHLANCYLQIDQKRKAYTAYEDAAKLTFDKLIQEDAFFNYAKLSYDLAYHGQVVGLLQEYINKYPGSKKTDEAREMLSDVFLSTQNYKDALVILGSIKHRTLKVDKAHQKVAYFRGIEFYNLRSYNNALQLFELSLEHPVDSKYIGLSHYWKGEIFYKTNKFEDASESYLDYLSVAEMTNDENYNTANYNLGYCYFENEKYSTALNYFEKFITKADSDETVDARLFADGIMRSGDCNFVLKNYNDAIDRYEQNIQVNKTGADYALLQKALILGIQDKIQEKISALNTIVDNFKESPYVDDAVYEIGNSNMLLNNNELALASFNNILSNYPNSSYNKKSLLNIGLIYYNTKEDDKSIAAYKEAINKFPSTDEAREALAGIKTICISQNKVDDYINYVNSIPSFSVSLSEHDSIQYEAAEMRYMKGNCKNSLEDFSNYLNKFPNGYFALNAHFYKAECEFKLNKLQDALDDYNYVLVQNRNKFTETALLNTSDIYFHFKLYVDALANYQKLDEIAEYKNNIVTARTGQMKSYFELGDYSMAILYANKVLMYEKSTAEALLEAHLFLGKSALAIDSLDIALNEFEITKLSTGIIGAEAHYNIALIQFKKDKLAEAEATIYEISGRISHQDYWIAKSFILLSDIYVKNKDYFQAKHTLQSIIDNYEGIDETIVTATNKLEEAKKPESTKEAPETNKRDTLNEDIEITVPENENVSPANEKEDT